VLASTDGAAFASLRHPATPRVERYEVGRQRVPRASLADWTEYGRAPTPSSW
jgi:hypothetical protein